MGRKIALKYATRGAKILIIGRRFSELENLKTECIFVQRRHFSEEPDAVVAIAADCSVVSDVVKICAALEESESLQSRISTASSASC